MGYIKTEEAIEELYRYGFVTKETIATNIRAIPSLDIVRCKECKRWWGNHYHDNEDGKCPMDAWIDGDGFCSYGERKSDE